MRRVARAAADAEYEKAAAPIARAGQYVDESLDGGFIDTPDDFRALGEVRLRKCFRGRRHLRQVPESLRQYL
jgi:hypothetical protein